MKVVIVLAVILGSKSVMGSCVTRVIGALDAPTSTRIGNQRVASIVDEAVTPNPNITRSTELRRIEEGLNAIQARPEAFYETVKTKAATVMSDSNGMFQGRRYASVENLEAAIARDAKDKIRNGELIFNHRDGNFYSRVNAPRAGSAVERSTDAAMNTTREAFPMNLYYRTMDTTQEAAEGAARFTFNPDRAAAREAIDAIAESNVFQHSTNPRNNLVSTAFHYNLDANKDFSRILRDNVLGSSPTQTMKNRWNNMERLQFIVEQAADGSKKLYYMDINGAAQRISRPDLWGFGTVIAAP